MKKAILEGSERAWKSRKNSGLHKIKQIVIIQDLLPKPTKKKRIICFDGIKSSIGVTWFKGEEGESGKIFNHVFPDFEDRRRGLNLWQVVEMKYPKNLIKHAYKESELKKEVEIKTKALVGQQKRRRDWNHQLTQGKTKVKKVSQSKYPSGKFFNTFRF